MSLRRSIAAAGVALLAAAPAGWAQSQSINATVEGILKDTTGAVLPGATVTVTNIETGTRRVAISEADGSYRALLLPLGTYRVRAELVGFKIVERTGLTLSAGETAVININLEVGGLEEVISVSAETSVTDPAKIDLGRTISDEEIHNLPLIARNPYNFALQQPNVVGYENQEFGATRMNANGTQMRTNYQIDGSNATQKNRAGLRMFQPSETMIKEVKVITSGFAPEFGQTTGMVFNAVTPSGTNEIHGQASYRFARTDFFARSPGLSPTAAKPEVSANNFTGALGGPIVRDRWHFYLGYEWFQNDLGVNRPITVDSNDATRLGLSSEALGDGFIPAVQTVNMFIAKTDLQIDDANRLTMRWSLFKNSTPENIGGSLNTREVAVDFQDRMDSAQLQLVSSIGQNTLNELRVSFGRRDNPRERSAVAGPGPTVEIAGVANFNGSNSRTQFLEEFYQIVNNFSWFSGRHHFKVGIDFQFITDERLSDVSATYDFATIEDYLLARDGTDPFAYTNFQQNVGDPFVSYQQQYYSLFIQDDFRIAPNFKLLYGIRYDLFSPPDGSPNAPAIETRSFRRDGNNLAPRIGFVWSLDPEARTVLRASTGIMYEPPLGRIYEDALLNAALPRLLSASLQPGDVGTPAYPGTLVALPPGVQPSSSIDTVNPAYDNQYALMTNVQIERQLSEDMSIALGYVNSTGRNLPVAVSNNFMPSGESLGDGRPIFDRSQRVRPAFNVVREIRSTGDSQYNAFTVMLQKRMSEGFMLQANYTWSKALDHGLGGGMVVGSIDREGLSDPTDQENDWGPTAWDQRHTFIVSSVIAPQVEGVDFLSRLLDDNQFGIVLQANSGLPFNIRSNQDLNSDGFTNDRPNGIGRNSQSLGNVIVLDVRYSRFFNLDDRFRLEIFADAKNLLDRENVRGNNEVVRTDASGDLLEPLPTAFPLNAWYQQRKFQLGAKITF